MNRIITALLAFGTLTTAAQATERDGVRCPDGTQAEISRGALRCKRFAELESICSPVVFGRGVNGNITMDSRGVDQCLAVVTGETRPSVMRPPVPGVDPPARTFRRVVNPTGPDKFVSTEASFAFPEKMPPYLGDASKGVVCPSGYERKAIESRSDRLLGIRCEELPKRAVCDAGWSIDREDGRDRCKSRDLLGNLVIGQYTIPENAGYAGVMGNPSSHGWTLETDRNGITDYWARRVKAFRFPVIR